MSSGGCLKSSKRPTGSATASTGQGQEGERHDGDPDREPRDGESRNRWPREGYVDEVAGHTHRATHEQGRKQDLVAGVLGNRRVRMVDQGRSHVGERDQRRAARDRERRAAGEPQPGGAEPEQYQEADRKRDDPAARRRQVESQQQRGQGPDRQRSAEPGVRPRSEPHEQHAPQGDAGAEAVPVPDRVAESALGPGDEARDVLVTARKRGLQAAAEGEHGHGGQPDRKADQPRARAARGRGEDDEHEQPGVAGDANHLDERAPVVVGPPER